MSELLPDHLGSADANVGDRRANKTKLSKVDNIIDWIQCFGIYIAVLSHSAPDRVADLLGYQSLIISASQYHRAGRWVVYDWRFRLKASAKNIKIWSAIEVIIWNMVPTNLGDHSRRFQPTPIAHLDNLLLSPSTKFVCNGMKTPTAAAVPHVALSTFVTVVFTTPVLLTRFTRP